MAKVKIISDPYKREISYWVFNEQTSGWDNINNCDKDSKLREKNDERFFLPFKVKDIVDTIISEYQVGNEKVTIEFQGTSDEYDEVLKICDEDDVRDKVKVERSKIYLANARVILEDHTKEIFDTVEPLIRKIVKDDANITRGLDKVSEALKDIIPICIFGNYSAGKSTFINALIGYEILPSGGDPVTAKIFEIKKSSQEDRAKVKFEYLQKHYEIVFENNGYQIAEGDKDSELIQEIIKGIEKSESKAFDVLANITVNIINRFEKKDKATVAIGNIVSIEVPFSRNGILGLSQNKFVIFDTPGSNSQSNVDHGMVLTEALEGFSNGIPVWVSTYDYIDSVDNAQLVEKLYQIDALDKRFTMIVVNKADSVELPKQGLADEEVNGILEYDSVEKMYSSGIYFLSAVMGFGSKNKDGFISDFLADVFDEKEKKFSNPEARSYKKLYEYNIMPKQIKKNAVAYCLDSQNIIYANSGLLCIEMEMEKFAGRYAAYNKCQMVKRFLGEVIDETGRRIAEKTAIREKNMKKLENELDNTKFLLLEDIKASTKELTRNHEKETKTYVQDFVNSQLHYERTLEELEIREAELTSQNSEEANVSLAEKEYEGARNSRWNKFMENSQNIFKGNFLENVKNAYEDWNFDSRELNSKKTNLDSTKKNVDKETADELMHIVRSEFRRNLMDAQERLSELTSKKWQSNAQIYRDEMVKIITGTDALTAQQRSDLSDAILSYQPFAFDDKADKVFIKAKYLQGNVLGIRFFDTEKLDTRRLVSAYNSKLSSSINEISTSINDSCYSSYQKWQEDLRIMIEQNITTLNPELRELTEMIREESETIQELQNNQQTITNSFKAMEELMSWKMIEE